MINCLAKENYFVPSLEEKGKKEHLFYTVLAAALYLLATYTMWRFMYDLCNMIGAIVSGTPSCALTQLLRVLPVLLVNFTLIYMGLSLYRLYTAASAESRQTGWKKQGITVAVLGAIVILYVLVGLITGEYESLVEGYPTWLYPLDAVLCGAGFIAYGYFAVKYGKVLKEKGSYLPNGTQKGKIIRKFDRVFYFLSYMVSLCGLAVFFYQFQVMDWRHGGIFFNVVLLLNYLAAFVMAFFYRFLFTELKEEKKKQAMKEWGICFLILNAVLLALYFTAVQVQPYAPNQNAFGLLPIEFTASFHAFPVIYGLNNIASPLAAILKGAKK